MLILWRKNLRRTIILKIKFRNRILREKTEESKNIHNEHKNLYVSLICKTKRNVYTKLHNKTVSWLKKKPWEGAEKVFHKESIILKEKGKTPPDNKKISWSIYYFFGKFVNSLNIDDNLIDITRKTGKIDLSRGTNKEYTNHLSKMKIKSKMNDTAPVFSFQLSSSKVDNRIQKLDSKKACQEKKIPLK